MFFFLIVGSTCTFVVYHFQYKKNIKYLVETKRRDFYGILSSTIDRTMICLAFGFMHRLLLSTPNLQLLILAIVVDVELKPININEKHDEIRKEVPKGR